MRAVIVTALTALLFVAAPGAAVAGGAELVAAPAETPWRSRNARLDAPAGLHITLFQELEPFDRRVEADGFGTAGDR